MKYTTENALQEIKRRAKDIRRKRDRKITGILAASGCFSFISLLAVISFYSGTEISSTQTNYGSIILSPETGGYILTAVLGFILGVTVTLIIKHLKSKKNYTQLEKFNEKTNSF